MVSSKHSKQTIQWNLTLVQSECSCGYHIITIFQCAHMQAGRDSLGSFNSGRSISSNRRDSMSPVSSRKSLSGSPFQSRGLLKGSQASSRAMASPLSRGSPGLGAAGMSPGGSRAGFTRMHDCSMGQLHDAYSVLCRKVGAL